MSNCERQRRFRERNPGYYGRLHAKRRAQVQALLAKQREAALAQVAKTEPLMLPAPMETIHVPLPAQPAMEPVAALGTTCSPRPGAAGV